MQRGSDLRAFTIGLALAMLAGLCPAAGAAERWQEGGSGAVAILPRPDPAGGIAGGSLYCAGQRWSLMLRLAPGSHPAKAGEQGLVLSIGQTERALVARRVGDALVIALPGELLGPIRNGTSLKLEWLDHSPRAASVFSLGGSKAAIDAVAPRCSQIDMSAYRQVALSPDGAAVPEAARLLEEDIRLAREFSGSGPVLATTGLDLENGRQLLFASLCGSKRYFGESGCSLTGYARSRDGEEWRMVYDTEGMLLYTDPSRNREGWPDLLTLPLAGATRAMRWRWSGEAFALDDNPVADELRGAREEGESAP
jgi:hypothetical protein